jgi:hypothetical protein
MMLVACDNSTIRSETSFKEEEDQVKANEKDTTGQLSENEWLVKDFNTQIAAQTGKDSIDISTQLDTLPAIFYQEVQARKIRIDCITEDCVTYLTSELLNFKNIEELSLMKTSIRLLPDEIGQLRTLKRLTIAWGGQLEVLPETIGELVNLEYLDLWRNQLHELPNSIGNLTQLRTIRLGENQLDKRELEKLKTLLPNCDIQINY